MQMTEDMHGVTIGKLQKFLDWAKAAGAGEETPVAMQRNRSSLITTITVDVDGAPPVKEEDDHGVTHSE